MNDFNQNYLIFRTINYIKYIALRYKADGIMIACDSPNVWRKDFYPNYKANRKENRDPYYEEVKESMIKIKDFFNECTSIPAVSVERSEADDIIAVAVQNSTERTVIVSSDKDFVQLLTHDNVSLYSPTQKEERKCDNPEYALFEKCIRGDAGDNIKSAYPRVRTNVLKDAWGDSYKMMNLLETTTKQGNKVKDSYFFNKQLIDLTMQPDYIRHNISHTLENLTINRYNGLNVLRFIGKHDMQNIADDFLKHKAILRKHYISKGVNQNARVSSRFTNKVMLRGEEGVSKKHRSPLR